jgi:ABC-type uncharacterized transport system ATPase subunit
MDRILLIEDGAIAADGTFDTLSESCDSFKGFSKYIEKDETIHQKDIKEKEETREQLPDSVSEEKQGKIVEDEVSAKGRVDFRHDFFVAPVVINDSEVFSGITFTLSRWATHSFLLWSS